ncbi:MAG: AcrR family transcriptional regulator [Phenylobacterium sp.]|jgi:AcrR family transcriptional regulator
MRTRDKIIQASIELFNEHGERQITTNHIAAHLGISPGNLYYHFRNKNDIIHNIFDEYKQQLDDCFKPIEADLDTIELLRQSLDNIFELMWRFNFFYSNLPDILARDQELQKAYQLVQSPLLARMISTVKLLKDKGQMNIDEDDISDFIHSLKLTVTFWISYVKTLNPNSKVEKPMVYKGVLNVLLMFKPYLNDTDKKGIKALQQHYAQLAD